MTKMTEGKGRKLENSLLQSNQENSIVAVKNF